MTITLKHFIQTKRRSIFYWLCLITLLSASATLLFYNLGVERLEDYDEMRHGVNAYEMSINNDYIVHTFNDEPDFYNCKPPLSMWLIALGYSIFGYSILGLRFFSALSMWLMIAVLGIWLKRYGWLTSIIAVGALTATAVVYQYHYARYGDPDALYQLFVTISMLCMLSSKNNFKYFYGSAVCFGFAFLVKSWHAVLIPMTCFVYLLIANRLKELTWKRVGLLLISAFAVILPWMIARYSRDGFKFLSAMFTTDVAARVSINPNELDGMPFSFYFTYLFSQIQFAGGIAISLIAWLILKTHTGKQLTETRSELLGILTWIFLTPVLFSFVNFKLRWYVFTSYTAGAVMLGFLVQQIWVSKVNKSIRVMTVAVSVMLVLYGIGMNYLYVQSRTNQQKYHATMMSILSREDYTGMHAYIQYSEMIDGQHVSTWLQGNRYIARMYGDVICIDGGVDAFREDTEPSIIIIGQKAQEALIDELGYEYPTIVDQGPIVVFSN